jgi:hypothetical protein
VEDAEYGNLREVRPKEEIEVDERRQKKDGSEASADKGPQKSMSREVVDALHNTVNINDLGPRIDGRTVPYFEGIKTARSTNILCHSATCCCPPVQSKKREAKRVVDMSARLEIKSCQENHFDAPQRRNLLLSANGRVESTRLGRSPGHRLLMCSNR